MSEILVLNNSYQPIARCSVEKSIILIVLDKAFSIKDSDKEFRSQYLTVKIPEVLVLKDTNFYRKENIPFTRKNVLRRDSWTCVYCGDNRKHLITIDHVIPKSRWDKISKDRELDYSLNSYRNTVAACRDCNKRKSDKLPEELGWKKVEPKEPISELIMDWTILYDIGMKEENA